MLNAAHSHFKFSSLVLLSVASGVGLDLPAQGVRLLAKRLQRSSLPHEAPIKQPEREHRKEQDERHPGAERAPSPQEAICLRLRLKKRTHLPNSTTVSATSGGEARATAALVEYCLACKPAF